MMTALRYGQLWRALAARDAECGSRGDCGRGAAHGGEGRGRVREGGGGVCVGRALRCRYVSRERHQAHR